MPGVEEQQIPSESVERIQESSWWESPNRWVVVILLVGFLYRLAIALLLPPGFDEAYYFAYTLNPSLSYLDHPPLVAIAAGIGPFLLNHVSRWTIRLGPLLSHTISLLLLYLTTLQLFRRPAAILAVAIATAIPIFQVGFGVFVLPDGPLILFWTAALYVASQEFFRQVPYQPGWRLALISLFVGLACLGKYHGLALGFGLVMFCLSNAEFRVALTSRWTALGILQFCLALSPVIIWNAQHDWVSFIFQSSRAVPATGYRLDSLLVTWLVGVAYLFPTVGFPLWWVIARSSVITLRWFPENCFSISNPKAEPESQSRLISQRFSLLLWVSLPIVLIFTLMGGYRQILPTWPMPGLWGIVPILGYFTARWRSRCPRLVWWWITGSGFTVVGLTLIAALHVNMGIFQAPGDHSIIELIPVETDASTQLVDVEQLRDRIRNSPDIVEALDSVDVIYSDEWFRCGYVAMAIAPLTSTPITCIGEDIRSFAYWMNQPETITRGLLLTNETIDTAEIEAMGPDRGALESINLDRSGTITHRFIPRFRLLSP